MILGAEKSYRAELWTSQVAAQKAQEVSLTAPREGRRHKRTKPMSSVCSEVINNPEILQVLCGRGPGPA